MPGRTRAHARTQIAQLPEPETKARVIESMFDRIAPRYDLMNRLLTFRMDVGWRHATVRALRLPPGSRVLDVACGTGDLCRSLAAAGYAPIGADFSAGMLAAARADAPLVRGDALMLPIPDAALDGLTCGFALRNFTDLRAFFGEAARVVRPGGRIALLEVAEPEGRVLRTGHAFYFRRVVPFVGRLLSDREAYAYLPASTAYLPTTDALLDQIASAGFGETRRERLGLGAAQLITATR